MANGLGRKASVGSLLVLASLCGAGSLSAEESSQSGSVWNYRQRWEWGGWLGGYAVAYSGMHAYPQFGYVGAYAGAYANAYVLGQGVNLLDAYAYGSAWVTGARSGAWVKVAGFTLFHKQSTGPPTQLSWQYSPGPFWSCGWSFGMWGYSVSVQGRAGVSAGANVGINTNISQSNSAYDQVSMTGGIGGYLYGNLSAGVGFSLWGIFQIYVGLSGWGELAKVQLDLNLVPNGTGLHGTAIVNFWPLSMGVDFTLKIRVKFQFLWWTIEFDIVSFTIPILRINGPHYQWLLFSI